MFGLKRASGIIHVAGRLRPGDVTFEPLPATEEDAIQTVEMFDAMALQNMRDLAAIEAKLAGEIESKTKALAAVREAMERGKALLPCDAADDNRKSYDAAIEAKRKRGDKHYPAKVEAAA